ncbi:MAG: hypothetical protein AAGL89_18560 [Pseudomonadota bacterium]
MKTKILLSAFAATALTASAVTANTADPMIDVNGDGFYSYPELGTVMPEITDEMFTEMDTTGDGLLDMAEVAAATEAGLLPEMES